MSSYSTKRIAECRINISMTRTVTPLRWEDW